MTSYIVCKKTRTLNAQKVGYAVQNTLIVMTINKKIELPNKPDKKIDVSKVFNIIQILL